MVFPQLRKYMNAKPEVKPAVVKKPDDVFTAVIDAVIYSRPNIESLAGYSVRAGTELKVLRRTKYFALVTFKTEAGEKKGYILLEALEKN